MQQMLYMTSKVFIVDIHGPFLDNLMIILDSSTSLKFGTYMPAGNCISRWQFLSPEGSKIQKDNCSDRKRQSVRVTVSCGKRGMKFI